MKIKIIRSIAVSLTLMMVGYMSVALSADMKTTSAGGKGIMQGENNDIAGVNSVSDKISGAAAPESSMAPNGSGSTNLQNADAPVVAEVPETPEVGGCCSK